MKLNSLHISRSSIFAAILFAIAITYANESIAVDGFKFRELANSYRRVNIESQYEDKNDLFKAGLFSGYVWAIVESWDTTENNRGLFSIPIALTNEQAARIVCDFIEKHPEYWHLPGLFQAGAALQEKFPPPYLKKSISDSYQDK